ncbi:M15 family metallopeptidase [Rhizobium ruizarguesonis]|uniref:M15 family metallopeptidase n=1 Tax=Rhizobium ruizarguesonis TaxID=2081791 RepID=UPI001030642B|nr:M15 family metallopeptidase [Rhizobium ruizarguesonis]MBY5871912.1 SH3 domain-containing protein [Rhizobium leguminosarum]TBD93125.1 hypothetical protein ELH12_37805 [Rhizobium ruizarguesonis]TBE62962.1 hypothetical protein ELH01_32925 [Rhizobium ruizarguesonis]TBE74386.1 hypothetical protein ELG99_37765 [Rhizobium ruizarguesonis]
MSKTTGQLRQLWSDYQCKEHSMVLLSFGPDKIRIAPPTADAWDALATVMEFHHYTIRTPDTDSYNCREITAGKGPSLHSFGIALDVNWTTNPFKETPEKRVVKFSNKPTQDERAQDVRAGKADTDMTPEMIADILAIRTKDQVQVLEWGGGWSDRKDCMHFELDVSPAELEVGIDYSTVKGWNAGTPAVSSAPIPAAPASIVIRPTTPALASGEESYTVIARGGLRLRSTASEAAGVIRTLPAGTVVNVLSRDGPWAMVDLQGDGQADGFVFFSYLSRTGSGGGPATLVMQADDLSSFAPDLVVKMFPATPRANITANLPFVLAGLRLRNLTDTAMALMALSTIRAETEGFVPISEGKSKFNTISTPFDRYEGRADLGNNVPGDGPMFRGRGYVQLTGRANYTSISSQIGEDLVHRPELANDPSTAGIILAQFLKNKEPRIRMSLANNDLTTARKLVNGGSNGLDRFVDAYQRGRRAI